MKAVSAEAPPTGADWVHEVKWDELRLLVRCDDGATTLTTTNGLDATVRFPELRGLCDAIGCDAIVDGEVVAQDAAGRPDFGRLQARMHLTSPAEVALRAAGARLDGAVRPAVARRPRSVPLPLRERRRLLEDSSSPPRVAAVARPRRRSRAAGDRASKAWRASSRSGSTRSTCRASGRPHGGR